MWKILIILITSLSISYAQERFSSDERNEFLSEVKKEIAEGKFQNAGAFSFEIIKPDFYDQLEDLNRDRKLTRQEYDRIKNHFEALSKSGLTGEQAENTFITFIESELQEINKKSIPIQKENEICNQLTCVDGLTCAPEINQISIGSRKKAGAFCTADAECSSYDCVNDGKGKKICEDVYRCFRPLNLGQSCSVNPICGAGICLDYDSMTSGIGECAPVGKSCKVASDCCSNSCNSGKCESNRVCKDCAPVGSKPLKLQKCCEGLYKNQKGYCVPDVPPSVIIEVNNSLVPIIIEKVVSFLFPSAHAQSSASGDISKAGLKREVQKDSIYTQSPSERARDDERFNTNLISKRFNFKEKSDFRTCDINLKNDFLAGLTVANSIDFEMSLLAFDYVMSGDQIDDYWRLKKSSPNTSLNSRLKAASQKNLDHRKKMLATIEKNDKELLCMCLDVGGYENIEDEKHKNYFESSCAEYEKYANAEKDKNGAYIDPLLNGDASGVKGKTLIVEWITKLEKLHMGLSVDVHHSSDDLQTISKWANEVNWGESRHIRDDLFKFHVKGSPSFIGMGAVAGAVLAAGVVAVLGGFSLQAFVSLWAVGAILASATTGGMGMWMVGSLRGAWSSLRPEISDYVTAPRTVKCGKKSKCTEYTRTLLQPFNNVCDSHISANGCVVKFSSFQFAPGEEFRYLVDPFIPAKSNISPGKGLSSGDLAKDLNAGYYKAKNKMISLNPKTYVGGKSGGKYVSNSYLTEVFIDADVTGQYIMGSINNAPNTELTQEHFALIMKNAKEFAIEQQMINSYDEDNLQVFAETALYYHFLWPKTTRSLEISYPSVGIQTYLSFMATEISGNLSAFYAKEALGLNALGLEHDADRLKTIETYKNQPANFSQSSYYDSLASDAQTSIDRRNAINKALEGDNYSADGEIIGNNSLTATDKDFIKTVLGLRNLRNSQLEASRHYNQEMSANGNQARMQKMNAVARDFKKGFASGRSKISSNALSSLAKDSPAGIAAGKMNKFKSKNSSGGIAGSGAKGSFFDSNSDGNSSKSKTGNSSNDSGKRDYSASIGSFPGGDYGAGGNSGSGYGRGSADGSNGRDDDSSKETSMSASSLRDMQALRDAVNARDKNGAKQYDSDGEASIFKQITNAYIRNYDKVLINRNSKDTIEDSE